MLNGECAKRGEESTRKRSRQNYGIHQWRKTENPGKTWIRRIILLVGIFCKRILQDNYRQFLTQHPKGKISKKAFQSMLSDCWPGADASLLAGHIWRVYDLNEASRKSETLLLALPQNCGHFICSRLVIMLSSCAIALSHHCTTGWQDRLYRVHDCSTRDVLWNLGGKPSTDLQSVWCEGVSPGKYHLTVVLI